MPVNPHNQYLRKLRDFAVSRVLLKQLIKSNVDPNEISVVKHDDGFLLTLRDGTRLLTTSTPEPGFSGTLSKKYDLPDGAEIALYDYVLRYKYPHFDAAHRPNSPYGLRYALEFAMHLQHRNSFWCLDSWTRSRLTTVFTLREGDQVFEAGPYMGFGTVGMSRSVGSSGRVVCLEAGPDTHKTLQSNIERNALTNVSAHYGALGSQDGEMVISEQQDQRISLVDGVVDAANTRSVPTRSIESLCAEEGLVPNFIILTINGAELMAIEGSADFLRRCDDLRLNVPGWYRDKHGPIGPRVAECLKQLGFEVTTTRDYLVFAHK